MYKLFIQKGGIVLLALAAAIVLYLFISIKLGYKYRKTIFGKRKITEVTAVRPLGGNLCAAYRVLHFSNRLSYESVQRPLTAALLYRWICEGQAGYSPDGADGQPALVIDKDASFPDPDETDMFLRFRKAASKDPIQTPGRLKDWAREHYDGELVTTYLPTIGTDWLKRNGCIAREKALTPVFTPVGAAQARRLIGFRNFLSHANATTVLPEGVSEDDCITYALLFGIQDDFFHAMKGGIPARKTEIARFCVRMSEALWNGYQDAVDDMSD